MTRTADYEKANPFDQLKFRPLVRPPVFHPASRAFDRVVDKIVEPMAALKDTPWAEQDVLSLVVGYAQAIGRTEYDKTQALSDTTIAHKVDEVFADIQGLVSIEHIPLADRKRKIGAIARARKDLRDHIESARDWARRDAVHYKYLGEIGAEEYVLRNHYDPYHHSSNLLHIEGDIVDLAFREFQIAGLDSSADLRASKNIRPNRTDAGNVYYYNMPTRI